MDEQELELMLMEQFAFNVDPDLWEKEKYNELHKGEEE